MPTTTEIISPAERVARMKEVSDLYQYCDESVVEPVRAAIIRAIEGAVDESNCPAELTEERQREIVGDVQANFRTFGGIVKGDRTNPMTHWLEGQDATFALGVPVAAVVKFVAGALTRRRKADTAHVV